VQLSNPNSSARAWAVRMGVAARSTPTKRLSGSVSAMGIRLAPLPQPSSSTRSAPPGGLHAEEDGQRGQVGGMRLGQRLTIVEDLVVNEIHFSRGSAECRNGRRRGGQPAVGQCSAILW